jgi:hypothetical protein
MYTTVRHELRHARKTWPSTLVDPCLLSVQQSPSSPPHTHKRAIYPPMQVLSVTYYAKTTLHLSPSSTMVCEYYLVCVFEGEEVGGAEEALLPIQLTPHITAYTRREGLNYPELFYSLFKIMEKLQNI